MIVIVNVLHIKICASNLSFILCLKSIHVCTILISYIYYIYFPNLLVENYCLIKILVFDKAVNQMPRFSTSFGISIVDLLYINTV